MSVDEVFSTAIVTGNVAFALINPLGGFALFQDFAMVTPSGKVDGVTIEYAIPYFIVPLLLFFTSISKNFVLPACIVTCLFVEEDKVIVALSNMV